MTQKDFISVKTDIGQLMCEGRIVYYAYIDGKLIVRRQQGTVHRLLLTAKRLGRKIGN